MVKSGIIYRMIKNISYLNINTNDVSIPYLWMSMRAYVEDNYPESDWIFCQPTDKPRILLASLYVWNYKETLELLEKVKSPNTLIVVGGPHQLYKTEPDWFQKHPYIDLVCQEDGYGEVFLCELLKVLDRGDSYDKVPFCVYPYKDTFKVASTTYYKRDFKWPRNIFKRFEEDLKGKTTLYLECSRGCPYSCVFCEWGGGTGAKVSFKPTEYILEDLGYLLKNTDIDYIWVTDANFGIIDRDLDIINFIINNSNIRVELAGPSKTNPTILRSILTALQKSKNPTDHKMSLQDLNPLVLENIKRKDLPIEKQLEVFQGFKDKTRLELILGLPGAKLSDSFELINFVTEHGFKEYSRYPWIILPTTPAYDKEYRESFNISISELVFAPDEYIFDRKPPSKTVTHPVVTSTYSYTAEDWNTMFVYDAIIGTWVKSGILKELFKEVKSSVLVQDIFQEFIPKHLGGLQGELLKLLIRNKGPVKNVVDISSTKLKMHLSIYALANLSVLINPKYFYGKLGIWALDKYSIPGLVDACFTSLNKIPKDLTIKQMTSPCYEIK